LIARHSKSLQNLEEGITKVNSKIISFTEMVKSSKKKVKKTHKDITTKGNL
jgi:peptidoglycan hydrolase CwlO-like protein